ncbi:hypothetical protein LOZ80_39015 [Paenibacillus sp. HWE-109]|uniref:hypothetical protein n=1 Tax=Paenibacillus sp. HWE-109 TaxID=1306526 RepID=UPI001EDD7786|nr:hypothetical protein [Paenibacillus sp. HWE-109]UKS27358.1 hypothetical protein LOZ80_39015 [Paenibacillus sp. HWE-109]
MRDYIGIKEKVQIDSLIANFDEITKGLEILNNNKKLELDRLLVDASKLLKGLEGVQQYIKVEHAKSTVEIMSGALSEIERIKFINDK